MNATYVTGCLACCFALLAAVGCAAETVVTDAHGKIKALYFDGETLDVETNIRIPLRGWGRQPSLDDAKDVRATTENGQRKWAGRIEVEPGKNYIFEQTLREDAGKVHLALQITAQADVDIEGVFFWLDVPISVFAGGQCELAAEDREVKSGVMPAEKPDNRHFLSGTANRVTMSTPPNTMTLRATFDRPFPITIQDTREWRGTDYSAFVRLDDGKVSQGETITAQVTLNLTGQADHSPAKLGVDIGKVRYLLDGFGGNYCFNIESPVTQYTLDNLRVAWARTEMTPAEWEPTNDNDSPTDTNWQFLQGHDRPDSNLRREFLLAKQIQERGIPYVISIWILPEWLYVDPGKGPQAGRRQIAPDKWDELLECLGSYLLYAKRQYGVEPDLFSFNEANIGVRVLLTAEEHREAIKRIGAHFAKLGLKTKMLLADATGARGTHTYAEPAANDPEAMKYVGAVGFHSWGGASPEQYAAWGDLAERLKLPLLVTELGVDAQAWRTRAYDSFHYALREVQMYQEILLYARPQGTMQWEFTSDYSIVKQEKDANGQVKLVPSVRFWFVKHFCNLTPPRAEVLTTSSDNPKVLITAMRGRTEEDPVYTMHIANLGASRPATISGVPPDWPTYTAIRTSETEEFKRLPPVTFKNGMATLELAERSLLTLTTMSVEE